MKKIIESLAKEFNKRNLTWAIGGSFLLKRYGINDGFDQLDIMVSEDSVKKMNSVMNDMAEKLEVVNNESYQTDHFSSYQIQNQTINIICNLKCNFKDSFAYNFDKEDISTQYISNNEKIYFSDLLDWYIIYQEIDSTSTTELIERYYESGSFLNNSRFNSKFGMEDIPQVKDRYSNLKKRIYQTG